MKRLILVIFATLVPLAGFANPPASFSALELQWENGIQAAGQWARDAAGIKSEATERENSKIDIRKVWTQNCAGPVYAEGANARESYQEKALLVPAGRTRKNGSIGDLFLQTIDPTSGLVLAYTRCDAFSISEKSLATISTEFPAPFKDYSFGHYWRRLAPPLSHNFFSALFLDSRYYEEPTSNPGKLLLCASLQTQEAASPQITVELACGKNGIDLLAVDSIRAHVDRENVSTREDSRLQGFLGVIATEQQVQKERTFQLSVVGMIYVRDEFVPVDFYVVYSPTLQDIMKIQMHSYSHFEPRADAVERDLYAVLRSYLFAYHHSLSEPKGQ